MQCPKCRFENDDNAIECHRCGIVFAKYARRRELQEQATVESPAECDHIRQELKYRILAVPSALVIARLTVATVPFLTRMLSMMVHESGHAVSAWICGYAATPGIWFTPISDERSIWVPVFLVAGMGCLSYWAWQTKRPHVIAACAGIVILQVIGWRLFYIDAQALIAFGGDGGSLVLGTLLMTTFYARRDSVLYEHQLRWGLFGLGAVSFMDAFHTWTESEDDIAFGEQNGVQTDPRMLVENYGWSIQLMVGRYVRLAIICLIALAIVYLFGILRTRKELNANG